MQDWKLPSQLITTDRDENEMLSEFVLRHERMRRVVAEDDLIKCLDFIDTLIDGKNTTSPKMFIVKYLDKTINN